MVTTAALDRWTKCPNACCNANVSSLLYTLPVRGEVVWCGVCLVEVFSGKDRDGGWSDSLGEECGMMRSSLI